MALKPETVEILTKLRTVIDDLLQSPEPTAIAVANVIRQVGRSGMEIGQEEFFGGYDCDNASFEHIIEVCYKLTNEFGFGVADLTKKYRSGDTVQINPGLLVPKPFDKLTEMQKLANGQ